MTEVVVYRRLFNPNHDPHSGKFAPGAGNRGVVRPEWLPPGSPGALPPRGGGAMPLPDKFNSSTEASNWLHENYGVESSFTGMDTPEDLVVLHDVCGGISDAAAKYPETVDQSKFGSLRFVRNGDTGMAVARTIPDMPFGRRDVNGAPSRGTIMEFDPAMMLNVNHYGGGREPEWMVAKDARGVIGHEMGHVYAATMGGGGKLGAGGGAMSMAVRNHFHEDKARLSFPSHYAQSDPKEMFAEVFATTVSKTARAAFTGGRAAALDDVIAKYNQQMRRVGYGELR